MRIKDFHKVDRPREKLIKYGVKKLKDEELLAIIFGSGKKGENVLELTRKILRKYSKEKLKELDFTELRHNLKLGEVKSCQLIAVLELGKRLFSGTKSLSILHPQEVWEELREIRGAKKEYFIVFYLDVNCQVIKKETVFIGSLNSSLIHPREIFEPAVKYLAAQIILAHNHPSGICRPSDEDIGITKQLIQAGEILGIEVVDHMILTSKEFFSFKEKKLI